MVVDFPSICETLGSIPSTKKKKQSFTMHEA
jgi:hypothetical protein